MGREKGPPRSVPLGVLSAGLAGWWRQTPPLPSPFHPGPVFAWSSRGSSWGQGRLLRGAERLGPTRKELAGGEFHSVILQESPGGGRSEPVVCFMLGKCRPTWWS